MLYISAYAPALYNWLVDTFVQRLSRRAYPDLPTWGLSPPPSIAATPPLIDSGIYADFQAGHAESVPEAVEVLKDSVQLKTGRRLNSIDTIIYCTGYHSIIPVPITPSELNPYPYPGSAPNLYRSTFPLHPDPAIRTSPAFPGYAPYELQAMCISQIWLGHSSLPALPEMQRWHEDYLAWRRRTADRYNAGSTFYTTVLPMADRLVWADRTAGLGIREHFGLVSRWTSRRAWRLWWFDREIYRLCMSGLTTPAMLRLFDMGKRKTWTRAREQIVIDNVKVEEQQRRRREKLRIG